MKGPLLPRLVIGSPAWPHLYPLPLGAFTAPDRSLYMGFRTSLNPRRSLPYAS